MDRILYLDFDGVLNSDMSDYRLDTILMRRIGYLVRETDARVVISSAWRHYHTLDELKDFLRLHVPGHKIIGKTPDRTTRGAEILSWLKMHGREEHHIAILDDNDYGMFDMGPMRPWLVQTDPRVGVQPMDILRAERLLRHGPRWVKRQALRREKKTA